LGVGVGVTGCGPFCVGGGGTGGLGVGWTLGAGGAFVAATLTVADGVGRLRALLPADPGPQAVPKRVAPPTAIAIAARADGDTEWTALAMHTSVSPANTRRRAGPAGPTHPEPRSGRDP